MLTTGSLGIRGRRLSLSLCLVAGLAAFSLNLIGAPARADLNPYEKGCELLDSGDYINAVQQFDLAIDSSAQYPLLYLKRGQALEKMGSHQLALKDFTDMIKSQPQNADGYGWRGTIYSKL